MKFFLNIGMHKTGSSALQTSLASYDRDGATYLQVGHHNHSAMMFTAFASTPHRHQSHVKNRRGPDEVAGLRDSFRTRIAAFCDAAVRSGHHTLLASGEDISLLDPEGVAGLRSFFADLVDEVEIIGYVRPPVSFMRSALQQRVVGGHKISFDTLYPNYRDRFDKFDAVFGADAVRLVKFDPDTLRDGDVVADFAARVGITLPDGTAQRANQSRSLEATAILFAQRRLGRGHARYPGSVQDNNRLVQALAGIGDGKIDIDPDVARTIIDAHRDDLAWMSARLGTDLDDHAAQGTGGLRQADDLLGVAAGLMPDLMQRIGALTADAPVDPVLVARAVDLLDDILKSQRARDRANP